MPKQVALLEFQATPSGYTVTVQTPYGTAVFKLGEDASLYSLPCTGVFQPNHEVKPNKAASKRQKRV
jgi:hypothetical protein